MIIVSVGEPWLQAHVIVISTRQMSRKERARYAQES
jgi:uncharacterized DUF497 family protein